MPLADAAALANPWLISLTVLILSAIASSLTAWVWALDRLRQRQPLLPDEKPKPVRWGLGTVLLVLVAYLAVSEGFSLIYTRNHSVAGAAEAHPESSKVDIPPVEQMRIMTSINLVMLVLVPILLRVTSGTTLVDLGLGDSRALFRDIGRGAVACLLLAPLVYGVFALAQLYWSRQDHPVVEAVRDESTPVDALMIAVATVIIAPAVEELLFRGVLLGWLTRSMSRSQATRAQQRLSHEVDAENTGTGLSDVEEVVELSAEPDTARTVWVPQKTLNHPPIVKITETRLHVGAASWIPNIITSLIFAGLHSAQWPAPIPLFFLSLGLGLLYQRTGRLVAPFTMHALFNGFSTGILFLVLFSGQPIPAPKPLAKPAAMTRGTAGWEQASTKNDAPFPPDLTHLRGDLVFPWRTSEHTRTGNGTGSGQAGIGAAAFQDPGRPMDEKSATYLCDLVRHAGSEPGSGPTTTRYLIMLRGGIPGSMLPLGPGIQGLGRGPENAVQLPEMSVSRRHALLEVDEGGMVWLTDLGSTNGTFRNGQRLAPHQPVAVRDGDRLGFGPVLVLKYACPDPCEERYQREIFERAVRDPLTGLFNRRYFLDQFLTLERKAAGRGLGLAVLMLDIDHFKRINDSLGHDAGDVVLREVAAVIRHSTRNEDLVARYGGEEFIAALPITSPDQAMERAERIRRGLSARRIIIESRALSVTASLGLIFAEAGRERPVNELISAADRLLYQAKNSGRDRVVFRYESASPPEGLLTTIDFESASSPSAS